jgi:hypothetical protein
MTQFDNTNKGTIAKNTRKEADNHPDIAGSINVEGRDFWINGWLRKNRRDGSSFYSLTVKPKQERAAEIVRQSRGEIDDGGFDAEGRDMIPF